MTIDPTPTAQTPPDHDHPDHDQPDRPRPDRPRAAQPLIPQSLIPRPLPEREAARPGSGNRPAGRDHRATGLPGIEESLRDPDPAVRRAAVASLAGDARGAGDALAWALADADDQVRRIAADALRFLPEVHIGSDGVEALLLAASRGRDAHVRDTAAETLRLLAESAGELYAQGLHDGERHLRVEAVLGLVELREVARVGESADDPAREVRVAVAQGLGRLGTERGIATLEQLIADHDPVVRMAAIEAAAELGVPEALAGRVVTSIAHSAWQVRKRAATALGAAPPDVAINPLIRALGDRIVDVRRAAVHALERWADRPQVARALTEALADPDPGVRTQVRWALA